MFRNEIRFVRLEILEDNNTRVLFERVLTSGSIPSEKSVDIWNKFLDFESNIGDLSSIIKVEKRRSGVLNHLKEFEGKETAQIVDRYKFLDIYPCSKQELKAIGYTEVLAVSSNPNKLMLPLMNAEHVELDEDNEDKICRPDFSQMVPFKPKMDAYPGEHFIPGGSFPMPPAAAHLASIIPPPHYFHGPFVAVDPLMDLFRRLQLPEIAPPPTGEGVDPNQFELAKSVHWVMHTEKEEDEEGRREREHHHNNFGRRRGFKRRFGRGGHNHGHNRGHDSEDEAGEPNSFAPPQNDIYRSRQQKRVK